MKKLRERTKAYKYRQALEIYFKAAKDTQKMVENTYPADSVEAVYMKGMIDAIRSMVIKFNKIDNRERS